MFDSEEENKSDIHKNYKKLVSCSIILDWDGCSLVTWRSLPILNGAGCIALASPAACDAIEYIQCCGKERDLDTRLWVAHLSRKQIFSRTYRVYVHASFCLLKKREGCIRCPAGCNFWCMLNRNKPPFSRFVLCACAAQVHAWMQQTISYIPIMSCDYASAT